jgi:hypothetical protein
MEICVEFHAPGSLSPAERTYGTDRAGPRSILNGVEEDFLSLPGIQLRFFACPILNLIIIQTVLFRLFLLHETYTTLHGVPYQ